MAERQIKASGLCVRALGCAAGPPNDVRSTQSPDLQEKQPKESLRPEAEGVWKQVKNDDPRRSPIHERGEIFSSVGLDSVGFLRKVLKR